MKNLTWAEKDFRAWLQLQPFCQILARSFHTPRAGSAELVSFSLSSLICNQILMNLKLRMRMSLPAQQGARFEPRFVQLATFSAACCGEKGNLLKGIKLRRSRRSLQDMRLSVAGYVLRCARCHKLLPCWQILWVQHCDSYSSSCSCCCCPILISI